MVSRASHERSKNKHAQRESGYAKPKLQPVGTDTAWMGDFIESIQGLTTPFSADSMLCLWLAPTPEERLLKLRALARLGVVRMSAYRENGQFVEYRFELTQAGRL